MQRLLISSLVVLVVGACSNVEEQGAQVPAGPSYADRCSEAGDASIGSGSTFLAVGGSKLAPFRSVAKLTFSKGTFCSGVLIEEDLLVTSAHCFESPNGQNGRSSVVGVEFSDSVVDRPTLLQVKEAVLHPEYDAALREGRSLATSPGLASVDIATIRLVSPVSGRSPIGMASSDPLARGRLVALVGYGDTGSGGGIKRFSQSHVGREIDDEVISGESFRNILLLDSHSGTGACPGDSGGGLFVKEGEVYGLLGIINGVNDLLYPGFPIETCTTCPKGIGVVTRLAGAADLWLKDGRP